MSKTAVFLLCLWISFADAQIVLVKDINTGRNEPSSPSELVNVNGVVFFVADDGKFGRELWKTDGTEAGTKTFTCRYLSCCSGRCHIKIDKRLNQK